jgi:alkanesulfonate monooxygenase SsuD/methylene tetrahydromethanopterin reductase-like flavin-dependent oxidoreductase (luciferase family)
MDEGARAAGRDPGMLVIAPSVSMVIAAPGDAAARRRVAEPVAQYVGRMGAFYPEMLRRYSYADDVAAIQRAWESRDPAAAALAVSDRLLDATAITGSVAECREKLATLRGLGAALPIVPIPTGEPVPFGRLLEELLRSGVAAPAPGQRERGA